VWTLTVEAVDSLGKVFQGPAEIFYWPRQVLFLIGGLAPAALEVRLTLDWPNIFDRTRSVHPEEILGNCFEGQ
jgi:hypothetical protein